MPPTLVPTLALLAALAVATAAETADATTEPSTTVLVADAAAFKKAARPLIREYIFSDYASFAAGELTFRTLKTHLSEALGLPYDSMGTDEHAEVIESITDAVANRCDGGKLERERCSRTIRSSETGSLFLRSILVAV